MARRLVSEAMQVVGDEDLTEQPRSFGKKVETAGWARQVPGRAKASSQFC